MSIFLTFCTSRFHVIIQASAHKNNIKLEQSCNTTFPFDFLENSSSFANATTKVASWFKPQLNYAKNFKNGIHNFPARPSPFPLFCRVTLDIRIKCCIKNSFGELCLTNLSLMLQSYKISLLKNRFVTLFFIRFS